MADEAARAGGRIFDIQRFSINDGPGIRTTVFLKGCPLRCLWCHNPEGVAAEAGLSFDPAKCIGCGYCLRACANQAHRLADGRHELDRARCTVCGSCTKECYAGALQIVGRETSAAEVIEEVLKDRPFYETSNGGMTLSGGEPVYQIDFTLALLELAKAEGLHTAVETCGFGPPASFRRLLGLTDLFLFDVKAENDEKHRQLTGVPLGPILENLRLIHDSGQEVWLRLPLVPGLNATDDHFRGIARLVADLPKISKVEVLPYHPLGTSKHARLGLASPMTVDLKTPTDAQVQEWLAKLQALGVAATTT